MSDDQVIELLIDGEPVNTSWSELARQLHASSPLNASFSIAWLVVRAVQIFLVPIGMLMLEVGSVSPKNTKAMIIKNIGNSSISAICFYLLGYGLSFGEHGDDVIGWGDFATKGSLFNGGTGLYDGATFAHFIYYYCVLSLVPAIVSGSLGERTNVVAYFVVTFFISIFITPVLMHWAWSRAGWASHHTGYLVQTGVLDFAGSSVIHVSGGMMALVGAWVVGPRKRRFKGASAKVRMPRQNVTFSALGAFFVYTGFYSLNMGVIHNFSGDNVSALGKIAVNTTLCACSSAIVSTAITLWKEKAFEPYSAVNGICAGLAGSSAGCATMTSEGALVTGCLCGATYYMLSSLLCSCKIDDVTDVTPIHLGGGLVGTITAAFFTTQDNYKIAILDSGEDTPCGALYACNGLGWRQLTANCAFLLAVAAWSLLAGLALFLPLSIMSLLRVDKITEDVGLDFLAPTSTSEEFGMRLNNKKI